MELIQLTIDNKGKIKTIEGVVVNVNPIGEPFLFFDGLGSNFSKMVMFMCGYFQKEADAYVKGNDHRDHFCAVQLYKITKY